MLVLMIEEMQLGTVEVKAVRLVGDDCIVLPAVPQTEHDLGELVCPRVTVAVARMGVAAEIVGFRDRERGHEIPAGAPAADLIERCKKAGHVEWLELGL